MAGLDIPQITVTGDARSMGRAQGEATREKVQAFMAMRLDAADVYLRERGFKKGLEPLRDAGRKSALVHREWDSEGYDEHLGIAEGAAVDPLELYTVANMTDMRDVVLLGASSGPPLSKTSAEGCSSLLVPPAFVSAGEPLAGQTWDLNPEDVDYVVAVHRKPTAGPETWSVVCTGCLTIMGMNEHGLAVGTTNIKTYGSEPGVGYLGVLHRAIRSRSTDEASEAVRKAPHSGAHTYWLADGQRQVEWEASPNGQFMREAVSGPVMRSNHCLSSVHIQIEGEAPSVSSYKRLERMREVLGRGDVSVDSLRALFSDRSDGVNSINRYAEDGQGTATNAVFIAAPRQRKGWICRGPADRAEWVEIKFGG